MHKYLVQSFPKNLPSPDKQNVAMEFGLEFEQEASNEAGNSVQADQSVQGISPVWSFWNSLKATSESVVEVVSKDLKELKETASQYAEGESKTAIESALDTLDDSLEQAERIAMKGITSIGSGLAEGFQSMFLQKQPHTQQATTILDRASSEIAEAGCHPSTYLDPLENDNIQLRSRFVAFNATFDQISHAGRIARLIDDLPEILVLMKILVPKQLSEEDFWLRYYFKISELKQSQATRVLLVKVGNLEEDEIDWSSEEEKETLIPETPVEQVVITGAQAGEKAASADDGDYELVEESTTQATEEKECESSDWE